MTALGVVLAVGNVAATFWRSAIPMAFEGHVSEIEVRREKHPGLDDVHLVHVDGSVRHLDAEIALQLAPGDRVSTAAWRSELRTPRGTLALGLSKDAQRMALAMPLLLALIAWFLRAPDARREDD